MKKLLTSFVACLTMGALAVSAAEPQATGRAAVPVSNLSTGWHAGIDFGAATPLNNGAFFGQMRPTVGFNAGKQISTVFDLGVEGWWGINTSSWRGMQHSCTAFDNSYIGAVGSFDLLNLFGGFRCSRPVGLAVNLGGGWGHDYLHRAHDHNYFAAKVGAALSFRLTPALALRLQPSIIWNISDARTVRSSATFDSRRAIFHIQAGISYNFGKAFNMVVPFDQAQIDGLNGQINDLRAQAADAATRATAAEAEAARLRAELEACLAKPVVREEVVNNRLNTVLDVFFLLGSSTVSRDQMPNVERIADYLKSHPEARVDIKGYASRDGNPEVNARLAEARALSVKNLLEKRFKIASSRITATGAGIGDLFEEESWNRVSVCTLED